MEFVQQNFIKAELLFSTLIFELTFIFIKMDPYKVLVVDDEEDLCEILQFNLETEGYQVDVAYSTRRGIKERYFTVQSTPFRCDDG